jgi:hypothetical protein
MNDCSTVPSQSDLAHSQRYSKINGMNDLDLQGYIHDLEDSVQMNRNMVHEFLIERISGGKVAKGEEMENLIYRNRILEAEIMSCQ